MEADRYLGLIREDAELAVGSGCAPPTGPGSSYWNPRRSGSSRSPEMVRTPW
ncbi:MAG: hypothetical protein ACR2JK_12070 [Geodermatophilaceae bacterium]